MAAAQVALDILEVLENIIVNVPAHQIHGLKQVSTTWNQLVRTSPRIRKARCLRPSGCRLDNHIPQYPLGSNISLNPALPWCEARFIHNVIERVCSTPTKVLRPLAGYTPSRGDFITDPRCQAVHVHFAIPDVIKCTLYNKNGIKIGDILDLTSAMLDTYEHYLEEPQPRGWREPRLTIKFYFVEVIY